MQQLRASQMLTPSRQYIYSQSPSALNQQSCSQNSSPLISQSNIIIDSQQTSRQIQKLYTNICKKKLSSKQLLNKIKSTHNITINPTTTYKKIQQEHLTNNQLSSYKSQKYISLQQQISISNYKKLLNNECDISYNKQKKIKSIQLKYRQTCMENQKLKQQNQKMNKLVYQLKVNDKRQQKRVQQIQKKYRELDRNYNNLIQESIAKECRYKNQLKRMSKQNQKYQKMINGIRESIRILKGRDVRDMGELWKEWKSIFQLASIQQCKLNKSMKKI